MGAAHKKWVHPFCRAKKMRVGSCCLLFREKKRFLSFGIVPKFKRTRIGTQDSEKGDGKKAIYPG